MERPLAAGDVNSLSTPPQSPSSSSSPPPPPSPPQLTDGSHFMCV